MTIKDTFENCLHELLNQMQSSINQVSDKIYTTFFALEPLADIVPRHERRSRQVPRRWDGRLFGETHHGQRAGNDDRALA